MSSNNNLSPPMMTMGFVEQEVHKKKVKLYKTYECFAIQISTWVNIL
jgi:hypothetical protein